MTQQNENEINVLLTVLVYFVEACKELEEALKTEDGQRAKRCLQKAFLKTGAFQAWKLLVESEHICDGVAIAKQMFDDGEG